MVSPKSNITDFIVKGLYIAARLDQFGLMKREVSLRMRGRSIISDHMESDDRFYHGTKAHTVFLMTRFLADSK